jgi:glycerol kinase
VLSASTLGSGVTASSLTSVGTIATGTWNGTAVGIAYGGTGATTAADAANAILPSQAGQSGKVLSTDGSALSWYSIDLSNLTIDGGSA